MSYAGARFLCSAAGLALGVAALAGPAHAQSAAENTEDTVTTSDIIVTAQRRGERLQDVPIAITAVTGDDLKVRGLTTSTDLNMTIPNLNVNRTVKTQLVYLRGVGNSSTGPGQEQSVAIYIDGVYQVASSGNVFSFNNIDHIEVLRGPQGTLFGRNSTGGLLQIVTKDPTEELSGSFDVGYANYDTITANAYVASGLAQGIRGDVAVQYSNQDQGWGKNLFTGRDVYKGKEFNFRSKLVIEPTDRTKVTLSGMHVDVTADFGTARTVRQCAERINASCVPIAAGTPGFANLAYTGFYNTQGNDPTYDKTRVTAYSGRLEQDVGFAKLVNITAWQRTANREFVDLDGVPNRLSAADWTDQTTSLTNELQFLSKPDSPVTWIAGAFYFKSKAQNDPIIVKTATIQQQVFSTIRTDSLSGFAQATVPIGEKLRVTGGIRYTRDDKSVEGQVNIFTAAGAAVSSTNVVRRNQIFENVTWKAGLDYKPNDDTLLYALVSSGFKSGVFDPLTPSAPAAFPEKLTDYEAGAKLDLLDRRVRLNLAGFYYDYRDLQVLSFSGTQTFTLNAANAKIYGFEADLTVTPTSNLVVRSSVGYTHSRYKNFTSAIVNYIVNPTTGVVTRGPLDASGNKLRTPDLTFNIGADYTLPLAKSNLVFSTTYYHNSGYFQEADNRLTQPAYDLWNASVLWKGDRPGASIRAWINNITSTKYFSNLSSGNNRLDLQSPGAPRTYGVTLGYEF